MGQEIVHCTGCGIRLRTADFEGGGALRRDGSAYCRACALQAGLTPEPPVTTGKGSPHSTSRISIATPRRPMEAVPSGASSPALVWGGVLLGVGVLLAAALALRSSPPRSVYVNPAPSASQKPVLPPRPAQAAVEERQPSTPKPAAASSAQAELAALERRVAEAVAKERFREAFDLLETERKRHDSLEWTAAVQGALLDLDASVKKLYQELQARMAAARLRGADSEVQGSADRIAAWGLPAYVPFPPRVAEVPPVVVAAPPASAPEPPPAEAPGATPAAPLAKPSPAPFAPGPMKWAVLTPGRLSASSGTRLTALEDGSILADGEIPETDLYSIVVQSDLKAITALRLEVLTDRSLPASGPGRAQSGNFVLTEFQVQVLPDAKAASGTPVAFERAAADHCQEGFPIIHAIDGRNDSGWAILPRAGRANDAIFELRAPLSSQTRLTLLVTLDHQSIHKQHLVGRFRLSASSAKGAASEISMRPPPSVDQGPVDAAIRRGLDWLLKGGSPGSDLKEKKLPPILNCDDLLLLTFLHSGVPENEPRFQKLLSSVLAAPYDHTYPVAIRAMALEELDRVRYQSHIARCAQFLLDNQLASGQWGYGEPSVAVEAIRVEAPTATALRPSTTTPATARPKPKIVQKILVRPTRTPGGAGDLSNSQYAALGLRACSDAGVGVPKEVLMRGMQAIVASQLAASTSKDGTLSLPSGRKPRGWCYDSPCACPLHRPYGTMTSGAVGALAIYDHLLGRDSKKDAAILDGLVWLQVNYAIDTVPGPIEWEGITKTTYLTYYLYALERAMILTGNERLGTRAWYAEGVKLLLETQKPDGSWTLDDWGTATWDTCFALLFLKRSTRPLVASTDRFHPPEDEKK